MRCVAYAAAFLSLAAFAVPVSAAEVEVKMLNKGTEGIMVFEPAMVSIQPGDSVKFVPTDKSHNAESIPGMLPEGATPFVGKMNEVVTVTLEKAGVYGYKCKPHYGMGMVGMVVVGEPVNAEAAKASPHPGKAKQAFATLFEKLSSKTASR